MTIMTDKKSPEGTVPQTPLVIHAQYLKDLSFENPHAPDTLRQDGNRPKMDMDISLDVNKIEDDEIEHLYDVSMVIRAKADRGDKVMFITDLTYSALVSINGVDKPKHHPLLFIEVPHTIFPFARQIISDATQAGGYIPLQLSPVDFRTLYLDRFGNKKKDEASAEEDPS